MGFTDPRFNAPDEWDELSFGKLDRLATRLRNALRNSSVRPRDVSHKHLKAWRAGCLERGCEPGALTQSISQFKLGIRRAGLQSSFPNLNAELVALPHFRTAEEDMHPHVRKQATEALQLLEELDKQEIIRKNSTSRKVFFRQLQGLVGYVEQHGDMRKVKDLDQILNQKIITECIRWGRRERNWTRDYSSHILYTLRSVLEVHPSYASQDWNWITGLICE
jgi:hypothetical protein